MSPGITDPREGIKICFARGSSEAPIGPQFMSNFKTRNLSLTLIGEQAELSWKASKIFQGIVMEFEVEVAVAVQRL